MDIKGGSMHTISELIQFIAARYGIAREGAGDIILGLHRQRALEFRPGRGWSIRLAEHALDAAVQVAIREDQEAWAIACDSLAWLHRGRPGLIAPFISAAINFKKSSAVLRLRACDALHLFSAHASEWRAV